MATTNFKAYLIHCITNLHVGSGDAGYGIIDKMVQRDTVTGYPTIHSSSLKGALRKHFETIWTKTDNRISSIFGKEEGDGNNDSGTHVFLNADLLALPVRCTQQQFVLGFDKKLTDFTDSKAENIISKKIFNATLNLNDDKIYGAHGNGFYAEDYLLSCANFMQPFTFNQSIINSQFATFKTEHFEQLTKNLPVLARNKVGENKNLWYEEFVPHQTVFITYIGSSEVNDEFNSNLLDGLIQIGGNASIGQGLCKFHEINF